MTTPKPSRRVSPEPTKGIQEARLLLADEVCVPVTEFGEVMSYDDQARDEAIAAFERAVRADATSAYIPLVEAARLVVDSMNLNALDEAVNALAAALVQVPGQQQADTNHG